MKAEALRYKALRDEKALYEDGLDRVKKELEVAEAELIEKMLADGITSTRIEGVGMITAVNKLVAKIIDKEKFFEWLRQNDHENMIKHEVNYMTLQGFANEIEGAELAAAHAAGMDYTEKVTLSLKK